MTVPAQCSLPSQTSSKVQALPSSHGVLAGWKASGGQYTLVPVQVSSASQAPVAPRQTMSALAGGGMHRPLDPESVVEGKRADLGGRRPIKNKKPVHGPARRLSDIRH